MKFLLVASAILTAFITPFCQAECVEGDCRNGIGKYAFESGNVYEGSFRGGQFSGQGSLKFDDGSSFVGVFSSGRWKEGTFQNKWGVTYQCENWLLDEEENAYECSGKQVTTYSDGIPKATYHAPEEDKVFETLAEWEEYLQDKQEKRAKRERIFDNCMVDKVKADNRRWAINACNRIADDPSWMEELRYN